MTTRTWLPALFAVSIACACGGSCGGNAPPGSGGGIPGDAGDAEADANEDHADAPFEDVKDAPEEPWGDAGWKPVAWNAPCAVQVAEKPELAVPPLIWDPCPDGGPGCEQARIDWDHIFTQPFGIPRVVRWGAGYRVGALLFYVQKERRSAIYDETGKALAAWRTQECSLTVPVPTPTRAWVGAQGKHSSWIVEPYETLSTASAAINVETLCQSYAASDAALGLWGVSGTDITLYDRLSNAATHFGPPPGIGYHPPYPVNESALMLLFSELNRSEGWIWNRSTNTAIPLIQVASPISVADLKSDGTTLVWVQAELPFTDKGLYVSADLWTSPFATDKAGVVATKRRPLPGLGEIPSHAGDGFYSLYSFGDKKVHVYRLSDARHWAFEPPVSSMKFYDVSYVDKDSVWYQTQAGIYRQALAVLGPGDPPP